MKLVVSGFGWAGMISDVNADSQKLSVNEHAIVRLRSDMAGVHADMTQMTGLLHSSAVRYVPGSCIMHLGQLLQQVLSA